MKQRRLPIPACTLVGHLISMLWFTMTETHVRPSVPGPSVPEGKGNQNDH